MCVAGQVMDEVYTSLRDSDARLENLIDHSPAWLGTDLQKALDHVTRAMSFMESAMDGHEHDHSDEFTVA